MPTARSAMSSRVPSFVAKNRTASLLSSSLMQPIRAPFIGYVPDMNPTDVGFNGAKSVENLVQKDSTLTYPSGWAAVPLGTGASSLFPIGDNGSGVVQFASSNPQPVTYCGQMFIQDPGLGIDVAAVFVTGNRVGAGANERGHFVTINAAGNLTEIPYDAAVTAGEKILQTRSALPDAASIPWGGSGSNPSGAMAFCNGHNDQVMIWDAASGGSYPGTINVWSNIATAGGLNNFYAESVESFADRLVFFNTKEGSSVNLNRVRWTALGTLGTDSFNKTGYGYIDLLELQEPGKRIERIGDHLACYSGDGVVFLQRQASAHAPVTKIHHSADRGLLSKFSLTPVGRDAHFGIFTDGWFFLTSQGSWTEAGQLNNGQFIFNKWKDEFYSILDKSKLDNIYVKYDHRTDFIYITFPIQGVVDNEVTWIYSPKNDSVWPQNWGAVSFGVLNDEFSGGETIGTLGGTIGAATGKIGDYRPESGFRAFIHGEVGGNCQLHRNDLWTRNGFTPSWHYESHYVSGEDIGAERELKRVYIERARVASYNPAITLTVTDEDGDSIQDTIATETGIGAETAYGDIRVLSTSHKLRFDGSHPQTIRAISAQGTENEGQSKRPEGS